MDGFVRDGDYLRVRRDAVWPQRCVVCNRSEGVKPVRVELLMAVKRSGLGLQALLPEGSERTFTIEPYYCKRHLFGLRYRAVVAVPALLTGLALIVATAAVPTDIQLLPMMAGFGTIGFPRFWYRGRSGLTLGGLSKTDVWVVPTADFMAGLPADAPAVVAEANATLARLLGED